MAAGQCTNEKDFERRFRCPRDICNRVHQDLMGEDPFTHKMDATGKPGMSPLVKPVACFRHIACGDAPDREDENLQMGETTLDTLTKQLSQMVVKKCSKQHLRCPTEQERSVISAVNARKGFPGCVASWDCKHFNWKNCPSRLAGQRKGHAEGGKKTSTLEAIADQMLGP